MFSEKVGDLWVELQAKKGNVPAALAEVQKGLTETTTYAKQYQQAMANNQGEAVVRMQAAAVLEQKRGTLAMLQAQNAFTNTPEGRKAQGADTAVNKQLQQAQAVQSWQKLVAEQGKSGAALLTIQQRLGGINQGLNAFASLAPMSFGAAVGWMERMSAAASPQTWTTFTSSWTYLSAVIGKMFVPYMIEAARWIQQTANWIRQLSPESKNVAGGFIVAGTALLGFVAITGTAVMWTMRLVQALQLLRATSMGAMLLGSGGMAGGAGAAGGGGAAAGLLMSPAGLVAGGLLEGPAAYYFERKAMERRAAGEKKTGMEHAADVISWFNPMLLAGRAIAHAVPKGGMFGGGAEAAGNRPGLLTDMNFQSQFFGIEDQWRRMQTNAASMSPLGAQIQAVQIENMQPLIDAVNGTTAAVNAHPPGLA